MNSPRILVVEDEAIVAKDIQNTLKGLGYDAPEVAHTGQDAIEKTRAIWPDLVLMDIHLRGPMDGVEAAEHIRAEADIPVIYVTAYSDRETLERAKITSPIGYIIKPFEERELHTTIEMALYRHAMEKRLKESEQWLATTLNSIGDAVIATDTEGRITFVNRVAEVLTGWGREDAVGKDFSQVVVLVDDVTRAPVKNPITEAMETGLIVNIEKSCLLVSRDGLETPVDDSASPIVDQPTGQLIGVVMVLQDVTERKQAEQEIRQKNEELTAAEAELRELLQALEERNRIITASREELARALDVTVRSEEELKEKNEELTALEAELREINQHLEETVEKRTAEIRELLQQKEEFISQLGHDLRSPLTPIVALVRLLEDQPWEGETARLVDVISRNVDYMKNLVEKTLSLATLSSTDVEFHIRAIQIADIVEDLLRRKQYHIEKHGIRVENQIDGTLTVAADELRLIEVLDNLISNGIKFMQDGGCLSFLAQQDGGFVTVSIRDTGVGLTEAQRRRIFDEFYKADESRHELGSAGLGLTICKRIIQHHGGHIWAESAGPGKGSTFHFTIPASAEDGDRAALTSGESACP